MRPQRAAGFIPAGRPDGGDKPRRSSGRRLAAGSGSLRDVSCQWPAVLPAASAVPQLAAPHTHVPRWRFGGVRRKSLSSRGLAHRQRFSIWRCAWRRAHKSCSRKELAYRQGRSTCLENVWCRRPACTSPPRRPQHRLGHHRTPRLVQTVVNDSGTVSERGWNGSERGRKGIGSGGERQESWRKPRCRTPNNDGPASIDRRR